MSGIGRAICVVAFLGAWAAAAHAASFSPVNVVAVGTAPMFVAIADLNLDGHNDIICANSGSNNVSVLLGIGGGVFQAAVNFPVGATPQSLAIADFNGDGKLDLATANF